MTQAILTVHSFTSTWIEAIAYFLKDLSAKWQKRQIRNATIKQLSALSNRELNDMGISRGDIWAIANGDPSYNRSKVSENDNLKGWV